MKSDLPKVLVEVCGRPMIEYVLDALVEGGVERTIVVVGYRAELVRDALKDRMGIEFVDQIELLGTGHAVMACRDQLADHEGPVVVLAGDAPLTQSKSIAAMLADFERGRPACILGSAHKQNPHGLGRVVRDAEGKFVAVVEEKDATDEQRKITEVNMSYYVFDCGELLRALDDIRSDNAQGEYYLTDCPGVLVGQGKEVRALDVLDPCESLAINTVEQLAVTEAAMKEMAKQK